MALCMLPIGVVVSVICQSLPYEDDEYGLRAAIDHVRVANQRARAS